MCGGSESSSSTSRTADNSRRDSRQAASDSAIVKRGAGDVTVRNVSDKAINAAGDTLEDSARIAEKGLGEAGDTLRETAARAFDTADGWRSFVRDAYGGAADLMQDANSSLEAVATTTSKDDSTEIAQDLVRVGVPAVAVATGLYFLSR